MSGAGFDLDAYLARIGHEGEPTLHSVHRAHVMGIPFENLDPLLGVPVSLELGDLQRKLVTEHRGGYCFEQNLLLAAALEALGLEVETMLGRTLMGADPARPRGLTHLLLRVTTPDGAQWHADAGFGLGTLIEPIPFGPGGEHDQFGWRFRVVEAGDQLVLQGRSGDEWLGKYSFVPAPVPMADLELGNFYAMHHPPFAVQPAIARHLPDGVCVALRDQNGLKILTIAPDGTAELPLDPGDLAFVLDAEFGLPGYAASPDGRLVRAGTAAAPAPPDTAGLVFTGVAISDLAASTRFYEALIGRPPDVRPADDEVMWQLNGGAWVYIVVKPAHAGHGLVTMLVDDLDAALAPLRRRGVDPGEIETAPGKYRRVTLRDPDGNTVAIGQPLAAG